MNLDKEDKIISEFLKALGPWRNHIIIGGGYALFIYKLYLADKNLKNNPISTRDIDSLIPRKVQKTSQKDIADHLREAGFTVVFKDLNQPATQAYVKEIDGSEVEIEFLTASATRGNKYENVPIEGIVAQPLNYLEMSLRKAIDFQTYSSETGKVVSPGAWIFHKGLTFTRRSSFSKKLKDLYGIWFLTSQLGDFSNQALTELKIYTKQLPKWFKTFQKNLHYWTENASPNDWSNLAIQDPTGKLKKLVFEKVVKDLTS